MKRLLFFLLALLVAGSASAATKVQVMTDGVIDVDRLPTVSFFQETDPASPELGQLWWNNSTNQLKVAGALGVYAFNSTNLVEWDTTPAAFSFTDVENATTSTVYTSDPITVSGINWPATISVSGDANAKYSINNATAVSTNGTVASGDEVRAVVMSSASDATATNATVTIGGVNDTYVVTTAATVGEEEPVACSGSITEGYNESFEKGPGEFCTTGWNVVNSNSIETYDDSWSNTGSYSALMSASSANSESVAYVSFEPGVASKYVRFILKTQDIPDNSRFYLCGFSKYSTGGSSLGIVSMTDSDTGGTSARLSLVKTGATEYFTITEGAILRIEFSGATDGVNSTAIMRVYVKNGESWDQLTTNNSNTDLILYSNIGSLRFFYILNGASTATSVHANMDDIRFSDAWLGE